MCVYFALHANTYLELVVVFNAGAVHKLRSFAHDKVETDRHILSETECFGVFPSGVDMGHDVPLQIEPVLAIEHGEPVLLEHQPSVLRLSLRLLQQPLLIGPVATALLLRL